jgi:DNA-binding transcriptional LysR family regulator
MELKWLEDFIALSENCSFSKAAETRYVTQPAFSRRIRALENWLGVDLIDRGIYPTKFTDSGNEFLSFASRMVTEIYNSRESLCSNARNEDAITLRTQHSITVSFLPSWLQNLEPLTRDTLVKVDADNLHNAVESFISGTGDFLLCYSGAEVINELARDDIESIEVGADTLVPVTGVNDDGLPFHNIEPGKILKIVGYPKESFLGRLVHHECLPHMKKLTHIKYVYENALAEGLKALVLKGYGVAWLPKSLIVDELATGKLVILSEPIKKVTLNIRLYRFRQCQSIHAISFWDYVNEIYK